ncbi:MAG: hypothetical protein U0P48_11495 [Ancrocorticia sp.]
MGRLRYDALKIDLPIYHGTSDETLKHGVGHLEERRFQSVESVPAQS